jgi:hypothetical protein
VEARQQTTPTNTQKVARIVPILVAASALWSAPHCVTNPGLDRARGQSGSEVVSNGGTGGSPGGNGTDVAGGLHPACPCGFPTTNEALTLDVEYPIATLRATLLDRVPGAFESSDFPGCRSNADLEPGCARVLLRIDQVLAANLDLEVGQELDAGTEGRLPCLLGTEQVSVGAQALVLIWWPRTEMPLSPDQLTTLGSVRMALWEEQILFAATEQAELRVPESELSELAEADWQCGERYGNWASLPGAFPDGAP